MATRPCAYNDRGIAYGLKGEPDRAIADFDQAAELDAEIRARPSTTAPSPMPPRARLDRAIRRLRPGDQAQRQLRRRLLQPRQRQIRQGRLCARHRRLRQRDQAQSGRRAALNNRGNAYANRRDFDRAIADLSQAIRLNPGYAQGYNDRGVAYAAQGRHRPRACRFRAGGQARRRRAASPITIAASPSATSSDTDRAIQNFDEAIKLNPNYAAAYYNRGSALRVQARLRPRHRRLRPGDQAPAGLRRRPTTTARSATAPRATPTAPSPTSTRRIKLDRKNALAFYNRGIAYRIKGDVDRAVADFGEAIKLDAEFALAFYQRGNAYFEKRDFDRAIADFSAGDPLQSRLRRRPTTTRGARLSRQAAITTAPSPISARRSGSIRRTPRPYDNRGLAYRMKGDLDRAIADFDQAVRLDPKSSAAYNDRGTTYGMRGDDRPRHRRFRRRASSSTARMRSRSTIAASPSATKATPTAPSPTSARRSSSSPNYIARALSTAPTPIYDKRDYDRAIKDFDAAIKLNANFAAAYNGARHRL